MSLCGSHTEEMKTQHHLLFRRLSLMNESELDRFLLNSSHSTSRVNDCSKPKLPFRQLVYEQQQQ